MHFGDRNDINTKDRLAILMRNHRFHGKDLPTQSQLDAAWEHLKHIGVIEQERPVYRETVVEKPRYRHYIPEKHYIITPRTFKKQQVRDKKTGRIIGWE